MYFKPKTSEPILWSSIEEILGKALDVVLQHLQQKYVDDNDALVYFTINQDNLVTGIRASVHVLKENTIKNMVENILSSFHRFVNSNENVQLDQSFEVFFKVLSGLHVQHQGHRRKAVPLRTLVGGAHEAGKCFQPGGILDLYALHWVSEFFVDQCLLVSLLYLLFKTVRTDVFQQVKAVTSAKTKRASLTAIATFKNYIREFCLAANIDQAGPHDLHATVNAFAMHYNCQVIIISSMDGSVPTYSIFPENFDFKRPRLYCYLKGSHIQCVVNLLAFFRHFKRKICFTCKKFLYFWNSKKHHKCHALNCCFWCQGVVLEPDFVQLNHENLVYCNSKIESLACKVTCQICQNTFASQLCFDNHFLRCKYKEMPFYCNRCDTLISRNRQPVSEVRAAHVCGQTLVRCKICFSLTAPDHVCEVSKVARCKNWPILATVTMFFLSNVNSEGCNDCYLLRLKYAQDNHLTVLDLCKRVEFKTIVCPRHISCSPHHLTTNAISVWLETQRFMFVEKTFLDDLISEKSPDAAEPVKIYHYSNSPLPFSAEIALSKNQRGISAQLFSKLSKSSFQTAEQKFFKFLMTECGNVTFLVESGAAMLKILDMCLTADIQPRVIQKGSSLYAIDITQIGVKFLNFANYVPGRLNEWISHFGFNRLVPFFPQKLNTFKDLASNEKIHLCLSDFIEFGDNAHTQSVKQAYFNSLNQPLVVKQFLCENLQYRSELFFDVMVRYLKQCFELQSVIASLTKKQDSNSVHPFHNHIVSNSGYVMQLCQYFYLNDLSICTVPSPYNATPCPISQGEYEYTHYMMWANPNLNIVNGLTSQFNQLRFGHITVDAYSAVSKTVYDFRGDWTHCHERSLCLNTKIKERDPEYCERKRKNDTVLIETLKNQFSSKVLNVETIYECQWNKFKVDNRLQVENFWRETGLPKKRQLIRLVPRASVRGGFLDVYRLKYLADDLHDISWIDVNSLYSHIALSCALPLGGFKSLTFFDLKDNCILNTADGQFYFAGESMISDIAMVEVLAPQSLHRPFLSFRVKDQFVFMSNCRTCSELKLTKPCRHRDHQRSFTSTWTCCELAYAVSELGYKILNWFEVHHFQQSKPVLADFVKVLASEKLRNTNVYPCNSLSTAEKQLFLDQINEKMAFGHPELKIRTCTDNPLAKNYYKNALNSLFGRFALHNENIKHIFCKSVHEIQAILNNANNEILEIFNINDDIMEVIYSNKSTVAANRHSNLYFTSLINAQARIFIYSLSKTLSDDGCEILSIDTDAICFGHSKGYQFPFQVSPAFGDYKHVLGEQAKITGFYSLGVRSYIVQYIDEKGDEKYLTKVKGLSLTSAHNSSILTPAIFKDFLEKRFQSEVDKLYVPQCRKRFDKQTKSFSHIISAHQFSNEIHVKRFILPQDSTYRTYSYGFDFKNLNAC